MRMLEVRRRGEHICAANGSIARVSTRHRIHTFTAFYCSLFSTNAETPSDVPTGVTQRWSWPILSSCGTTLERVSFGCSAHSGGLWAHPEYGPATCVGHLVMGQCSSVSLSDMNGASESMPTFSSRPMPQALQKLSE